MNRLVRADLKRIVAKPTLYLVVIIMVIIVMALDPSDTAAQQMEFYRTFSLTPSVLLLCSFRSISLCIRMS